MLAKFKKIAIGSDHAGYELKEHLKQILSSKNIQIFDYGTFSPERFDYPDAAHPVADAVAKNIIDGGILICGSGIGVSITANRHKNVRAALCWNKEIAALSRKHNDAQIIALPARFISLQEAEEMIEIFFNTEFEGDRHLLRIKKIENQTE